MLSNRDSEDEDKEQSDMPETPGWQVTFGDMMTLLLSFFVLLISWSVFDEVKFKQAASSLQGSLGVLPQLKKPQMEKEVITPGEEEYLKEQKLLVELGVKIKSYVTEQNLTAAMDVILTEEGLTIRLKQPILFDSGEAQIKKEALPILDEVARLVRNLPNDIRITGHTDNVPINTTRFPSNWELSTARATTMLRHLLEKGKLERKRLSAAGYASYKPVASNDTASGRAQNRRVEIVISREFRDRQ